MTLTLIINLSLPVQSPTLPFPHLGDRISDTIVREFAVTCLMLLSDSTFKMVLPQLVQGIKVCPSVDIHTPF